jgi:2-polyprenyl-3-methyl-5-hydroxy-6-metoxy-1,4-benzoquinol methylase
MLKTCEICGASDWTNVYSGMIRDGAYGKQVPGEIYCCGFCNVVRLDENFCIQREAYETKEYRSILDQGHSADEFFSREDPILIHNLTAFWPLDIRGKIIADIGTGGGSFADHIAQLAKEVVVIEPAKMYHSSLKERGYQVFNYTADSLTKYRNLMDFVFSFQVIEHVQDPILFIKEALELLKPGGQLIIATPNRDDILMNLLPENFPAFFYRTQHRWYFNHNSFSYCFKNAAENKAELRSIRFAHTFGISNTLAWLREKCPKGNLRLEGINSVADKLWASYLESSRQTDTLYLLAEKGNL